MLRPVALPESIQGRLYLSRMPGRYGDFALESAEITQSIDRVISLASRAEIKRKSPDYAQAIEDDALPWERIEFVIADFDVPTPAKHEAFIALVRGAADEIRQGQRLLIHCGAGVGRTGTVAACVLMALGSSEKDALVRLLAAGSHPETSEQQAFVHKLSQEFAKDPF